MTLQNSDYIELPYKQRALPIAGPAASYDRPQGLAKARRGGDVPASKLVDSGVDGFMVPGLGCRV